MATEESQGTCLFAGVGNVEYAEFTLTSGITPSIAILRTIPEPSGPLYGILQFSYEDNKMVFRDCRAAHVSLHYREDFSSGQMWEIVVMDRRWRWRYGSITGRYNVRRSDGSIDPDTEKNPQQLAELLFQAMGEAGADFSQLPSRGALPEVNWDEANPAKALADLAEMFGCVISLGLSDQVTIWKLGNGMDLPVNTPNVRAGRWKAEAIIRPRWIKLIGPPVVVQAQLKLTAVGIENSTNDLRELDRLSYKPSGGWGNESHVCFGAVAENRRRLAFESVWRYYLATALSHGESIQGLEDIHISDIRQVLPLMEKLASTVDVR